MDGEVRGEEHPPPPKKEGHHVGIPRQPRNGQSLSTHFCVPFKEGDPLDSYYT